MLIVKPRPHSGGGALRTHDDDVRLCVCLSPVAHIHAKAFFQFVGMIPGSACASPH